MLYVIQYILRNISSDHMILLGYICSSQSVHETIHHSAWRKQHDNYGKKNIIQSVLLPVEKISRHENN